MFETLLPNVKWDKVIDATYETVYMTAVSVFATFFSELY